MLKRSEIRYYDRDRGCHVSYNRCLAQLRNGSVHYVSESQYKRFDDVQAYNGEYYLRLDGKPIGYLSISKTGTAYANNNGRGDTDTRKEQITAIQNTIQQEFIEVKQITQALYKNNGKSNDWQENTRYDIVDVSVYIKGTERQHIVTLSDGSKHQCNRFLNDIVSKLVVEGKMRKISVQTEAKRWFPGVKKEKYLYMSLVE